MANAKLKAKIADDELAEYAVPAEFWKEGWPHPEWINDPLLYVSSEVAQAFLDNVDGRKAQLEAFEQLRELDKELDALPEHSEPGEQLLLVDIPILRYVRRLL